MRSSPTRAGSAVTICGTSAAQRIIRRQVTELPEIKPVVLETRQHEVVCPACHTVQAGALPADLAATRHFGPRLEALVTYLHHEQHVSFERLQASGCAMCSAWTLSEGGAVAIIERAGAGGPARWPKPLVSKCGTAA